jgi:hypothetical protein
MLLDTALADLDTLEKDATRPLLHVLVTMPPGCVTMRAAANAEQAQLETPVKLPVLMPTA